MYSIKRDPLARQESLLWLLTASGDDVGVGFGFGFFLPKNGMMPKEAVGEFGFIFFEKLTLVCVCGKCVARCAAHPVIDSRLFPPQKN